MRMGPFFISKHLSFRRPKRLRGSKPPKEYQNFTGIMLAIFLYSILRIILINLVYLRFRTIFFEKGFFEEV